MCLTFQWRLEHFSVRNSGEIKERSRHSCQISCTHVRSSSMMESYTVTERAKCAAWFEWTRSAVEVQRKFHSEYGRNRKAPDGRSIRRWHEMLLTTGSLQNVKRERSLSSRTEENVERVVQHFEEDPHSSTRRASHVLDMSRRTIQRILHGLNPNRDGKFRNFIGATVYHCA